MCVCGVGMSVQVHCVHRCMCTCCGSGCVGQSTTSAIVSQYCLLSLLFLFPRFVFYGIYLIFNFYAFVSVWGYLHMKCNCPWKPEEGVRFPGARVRGGCALPDLGCSAANSSSL